MERKTRLRRILRRKRVKRAIKAYGNYIAAGVLVFVVRGCGRRSSKANSKHATEEYTGTSTDHTADRKHHRRSGNVPVQPYVI